MLEFRFLRRDCDKLITLCYNNYICKTENEIGKNPKYFWTHLKNLRTTKSNYPHVMTCNGIKATTVDSICDLFAKHFSSVYENDNTNTSNLINTNMGIDPPSDIEILQLSRDSIYKKLKRLDLGKGAGPDNIPPVFLELTEVTQIRDLGVIMDSRLTFVPHIDYCLELANKSLGFIMRSSKGYKSPLTTLKLFYSLVRSRLEYCSLVWSPYKKIHTTRLESVQKRLLRQLSYRFKLKLNSYDEGLRYFNINSLQNRREILAMTFLYKVLNNEIDCPDIFSKFAFHVPPRIPRHPCNLLEVRVYRTDLGKNSPVPRLSRLYNSISTKNLNIDICHDKLPQFKRKVLDYLCKL
ncbi:unnamed protein product [Euphydryas editha]|uniref:Reverse transcriptase domain-containing protein n=1 Tax=Euphydryas editha TaxID=104508 RepID=A0AAU9VBD1_EUPED|nr:unnamed protein product [Euphydryas editha]